jgi:hypothetical protein
VTNAKAVIARMPNPSHAITSGSYAGSLKHCGLLQAGLQKLTPTWRCRTRW